MMAKSTYHVNGMSNRIGAPSPRARFLGIAIGIAISKMVDKPELQLKIELEGEEATEAKWYDNLTQVDDKIGSIAELRKKPNSAISTKPTAKPKITTKATNSPVITEVKGPRIVEVLIVRIGGRGLRVPPSAVIPTIVGHALRVGVGHLEFQSGRVPLLENCLQRVVFHRPD